MRKKIYFENLKSHDEIVVGTMSKYENLNGDIKMQGFTENYQRQYKLQIQDQEYRAALSKIQGDTKYYILEDRGDCVILKPIDQSVHFTRHDYELNDQMQEEGIEKTLQLMKTRKLSVKKDSKKSQSFSEDSQDSLKELMLEEKGEIDQEVQNDYDEIIEEAQKREAEENKKKFEELNNLVRKRDIEKLKESEDYDVSDSDDEPQSDIEQLIKIKRNNKMGAICCYEKSPSLIINQTQQNNKKENVLDKNSDVNLQERLTQQTIDQRLIEVQKLLNLYPYKQEPNRVIKDFQIPFSNSKLNFWMELENQNTSSNLIHHYFSNLEFPFTPELAYLYLINLNQEGFQELDGSIDEHQQLNYQINDDQMIIINSTKTKKVLVVQPRFFVIVRIIKRLQDGSIIEYQESIQNTVLNTDEFVREYLEKFDNLANIHFNVIKYEKNSENKNKVYCYNKVDIVSQVGKKLILGTLKTKMKKYHEQLLKQMAEFILSGNKQDLLWFTSDKNKIEKIFVENQEILIKGDFQINKLSQEAQQKFRNLVKQKNDIKQEELKPNLCQVDEIEQQENISQTQIQTQESDLQFEEPSFKKNKQAIKQEYDGQSPLPEEIKDELQKDINEKIPQENEEAFSSLQNPLTVDKNQQPQNSVQFNQQNFNKYQFVIIIQIQ